MVRKKLCTQLIFHHNLKRVTLYNIKLILEMLLSINIGKFVTKYKLVITIFILNNQ